MRISDKRAVIINCIALGILSLLLKTSRSTVYHTLNRFKEFHSTEDCPRSRRQMSLMLSEHETGATQKDPWGKWLMTWMLVRRQWGKLLNWFEVVTSDNAHSSATQRLPKRKNTGSSEDFF